MRSPVAEASPSNNLFRKCSVMNVGTNNCKLKNIFFSLVVLFLLFSCFAFLNNLFISGESTDQATFKESIRVPDIEYANKTVYVGIWVLNFYDFTYKSGLYTFEMEVYFFWVDSNISAINWNLINGYPIPDSQARVLVDKNEINGIKYEVYSITARFSQPPIDSNFPFDNVQFLISLEILGISNDVNLLWLKEQTGVSSNFNNPGWKTTSIDLLETKELNPLMDELPRADMKITQERILPGMIILTYLPPLIFAILGGCSFLFIPKNISLVGTRIALLSSMMVAMIVFVFTALSLMPITSTLPRYGIFILTIIIFLTTSLIVSILSLVYLVRSNNQKQAQRVNRFGFIISTLIPIVFFLAFYY